ncbi:MAG: hypothetical protein UT30_C0007G0036 [Candidatus Uhrbacteria bacterium GW2011_GWF2_39_13]|uniref:Uncharacterized protein n=1 Tax=Candidatus Uhrbacteria bacterium GW2011_GWF2_39_13 TaxID=1618995 RepID=A0A0G0Q218_9BACT|nr:MAG: hypothetical protein UT30_C0007G0036 [Candidatus Uhrbacteria bacterium GW2011_GWF2_39_13]HAU66705.1 hypothetical protein [Candidatus Uhrbacteria bacterium]
MPKDARFIDSESSKKKRGRVETRDVSVPSTPETIPEIPSTSETKQEQPERFLEAEKETQQDEASLPGRFSTTQKTLAKKKVQEDRLEEEIEDILEEDLKDLYLSLPPKKQAEFRLKGEEIRSRIRQLTSSVKINAKKIFQLIRSWLKVIPGVNRFFLEQTAKIKTDKILMVAEEEQKRTQKELM